MRYTSLRECVNDLDRHGHLTIINDEVDPYLEMAEIHRRVFQARGPALLFKKVKGSSFPAVSNLFGTLERSRFLFRSTLERVKRLMEVKADPSRIIKQPWRYGGLLPLMTALPPKRVRRNGPVLHQQITIEDLPAIQCWPDDGGPFILLPQVYSEDPDRPGISKSNLGMYRIQLSGNEYRLNREIGLHYQIRRDIGIHHSHAIDKKESLRVSIFVGGPPSHPFAAVMPLPEGLPEVLFGALLGGRRFRYTRKNGHLLSTDADFCITGTVAPSETLPEGPFGDHLGYYSLTHPFPVLQVESVTCRRDAIWPFTVVGRPPQEDTSFGTLIQEIVGPLASVEMPGVKALHAVDAAGVHPLLLAIGQERFTPYQQSERPQELLKIAHSILGYGAASLTKYLFITGAEDNPDLDVHRIKEYFTHVLERVDWKRDLHFQTETTIDSLDYSGSGFNQGSKVIIAARGHKKRDLAAVLPETFSLPPSFANPEIVLPGILALTSPPYQDAKKTASEIGQLENSLNHLDLAQHFPLILLVDDAEFTGRTINNFLWVSFTRSDPAHDIHGLKHFITHKHWGCAGPLIIDARLKPHHAPPLIEDPKVTRKVDALGKKGGCLHGII